MSVYQWQCLIGVPAIFSALTGFLFSRIKNVARQTVAVEKGIQALLRAQMIADYNYYAAKGYAPIYARENFENCYVQYHALGGNGVMTDLHTKFMGLQTGEEKKHED